MSQPGFFDLQHRYQSLEGSDPLVHLAKAIAWEQFRPLIEQIHKQNRKSAAGRPAWDAVLVMKALVLSTLYNLSDDQLEYQIRDRLSFMRFLGLQLEDRVPDAKTLWRYREQLTRLGIMAQLFERFERYLRQQGYQARKGQIVDATIVPVPRQRNTREENQQIKAGETPEQWSSEKVRQKDVDARWAMKDGQHRYGYKNHLSVDIQHRFVRSFAVSAANMHDGQYLMPLLDRRQRGAPVYADKAYRSIERAQALRKAGYIDRLHYTGHKYRPLTQREQQINQRRSKIRARVEHVFGYQQNSMGGKLLRCIGLIRAEGRIGLMNLVHNFMRLVQLRRMQTR